MKTLIQAAAVTLFAASAAQAQQAVQWRVEDGGNGRWYQLVANPAGNAHWTFDAAQSTAVSRGAHLLTFATSSQAASLHSLLQVQSVIESSAVWVGLYQDRSASDYAEPAGGWRWVGGAALTIQPWLSVEPSNAGCWQQNAPQDWGAWVRWSTGSGRVDDMGDPTPTCPDRVWMAAFEWSADCNSDGIVDYGQILDGSLSDVNDDGVPDACQAPCVPADLNNDGSVDGSDLGALLSDWGPTAGEGTRADINGDGIVTGADLGALLANWGPCGMAPPWATVIQWSPDPSVVASHELRSRIIATGQPWRVRDTGSGIEMLLVPPGMFEMGCSASSQSACAALESPVHLVRIERPFYLGRFEVTQSQWTRLMGSNPSQFQGGPGYLSQPVDSVTWEMTQGFLERTAMRLPSEAQWEYACRAGTTTAFHAMPAAPNGTNSEGLLSTIAWYGNGSGSGTTQMVGLKAGNGLGFHDMSGNVWEWVRDWYDGGYYTTSPGIDPPGPASGAFRVARGGGFTDGAFYQRSSCRHTIQPGGSALYTVGFRVARDP